MRENEGINPTMWSPQICGMGYNLKIGRASIYAYITSSHIMNKKKRRKELEKEYRELWKFNNVLTGEDADKADKIVAEWKSLLDRG